MKETNQIVRRYVGGGDFIPGVPARDLTRLEEAEYLDTILTTEKAIGRKLYEQVVRVKKSEE